MRELIRVTQLPIIEEELRSMKAEIERRTKEATSLACTPETIQSVKSSRADLRKQLEDMESRRVQVKKVILQPYNEFEKVYRECVSDPMRSADAELKRKIEEVEMGLKQACEENLREYFNELCVARNIDFCTFEQAGVKVDLASAKTKTAVKLRRQLDEFIQRIEDDLKAINLMPDFPEILVEYKKSLNVSEASWIVLQRKERIKEEMEAAAAREEMKKKADDAGRLAKEAAQDKVTQPPEKSEVKKEEPERKAEEEGIFRCTFTVFATKEQLRKIKKLFEEENIRYE